LDLAQSILEVLGQSYGNRGVNGWTYLGLVAISIAGALSAKELAQRRSRLGQRSIAALQKRKLLAAVLKRRVDEREETHEGHLMFHNGRYILTVTRTHDGEVLDTSEASFSSWDEVARHLESQTLLRVGDFKETAANFSSSGRATSARRST
jgi:hypothetical protein